MCVYLFLIYIKYKWYFQKTIIKVLCFSRILLVEENVYFFVTINTKTL